MMGSQWLRKMTMRLTLSLLMALLVTDIALATRQTNRFGQGNEQRKCSPGQFHQESSGTCEPCSDCPLNQIIRTPCSDDSDTTCSPFYEFENFNQGADELDDDELGFPLDLSTEEKTATGLWSTRPLKSEVDDEDEADEEDYESQAVGQEQGEQVVTPQSKGPSVQNDVRHWKQLCFGLIGALAVITFIAFLYILISQIHARKHPGKTIAIADPDDPTIYYRTRVFSRERLNTSDYKVNLENLEADNEAQHGKKWLLWRLFHPRSHRHYGRVYEVDSHGLFPLQIIPNPGVVMAGDHLDVPAVHAMGSTDSGFSAGTQSNLPI